MKTIKIFDQCVSYINENNKKQKLLFIHGFRSNSDTFVSLQNLKNRNYDIVTLSLPIHNEKFGEKIYTIEYYASFIEEFIKKMKLYKKKIILVGHSLGGAVVINLAHLVNVKKIVLVAPFNPFVISNTRKDIFNMFKPKMNSKNELKFIKNENKINIVDKALRAVKLFRDNVNSSSSNFNFLIKKQMFSREYQSRELFKKYKENTKPTLVIAGANDLVIGLNSLKETTKTFGYELRIISNAWHSVINDAPEVINEILNNFLIDD